MRESPKRARRAKPAAKSASAKRAKQAANAGMSTALHETAHDPQEEREQAPQPHEAGQAPSAELLDAICGHLSRGASWSVAAYATGVDPDELDGWIEKGVLPGAAEPYKTFARAVYKRSGEVLSAAQAALFRIGAKDPRALAVLFEMRSRDVEIRGDGRQDPLRNTKVKRIALACALRTPNPELKAVMDEAGVLALNDAQRAVLEEAGLLAAPIRALPAPSPDQQVWPAESEDE
jgi:hypothetical protein